MPQVLDTSMPVDSPGSRSKSFWALARRMKLRSSADMNKLDDMRPSKVSRLQQ